MKKFAISQKWINLLISCLLFLIIYSIIYSVMYIHICIKNEQNEETLRYEYEQISQTLVQTSDYMTEEVRNFVVTKDFRYLDDYWEEVEINKNREKVIEKLNTMKLSESEKRNVSLAKEYSDYLMDTELRAMKLIIESLKIENLNLPDKLLKYKLNVSDEKLNEEEKKQKALEILFNEEYLQGKKVISGSIKNFQTSINDRLTMEMNKSIKSTTEALTVQTCLLSLSFVLVIIVLIVFYKAFMFPITNYIKILNDTYSRTKKYNLKPEGSKELRILAEQFNTLYENLVKADNAKSEFLATMSHEIRTPLNTIIGYNQILSNTTLTDKQMNAVNMSKFAAKNLMNIINNILDFSKLENNKFEIENVVFDFHNYMTNFRKVFLNESQKRGLYFNLFMEEDTPKFVYGDVTKLNQILMNIISNGLKFMNTGGITLKVSWKNINFRRIKFIFEIQDTGIGIKPDKIKNIFEPFEQSNASITRKYGGTGLGLAICKKLAKLFDGDVTVESTYGVGSTFYVTVVLQRATNEEKEEIELQEYMEEKVYFDDITVLIVDDNEINSIMEKELLKDYGFDIWIVNSGFEAVELCRKRFFNLILMDIRMEEMDGYETTKRIRKNGLCKESYIMALSADGIGFMKNKEKNLGIDDFLTKPLDIDVMISKLKEVFQYRVCDNEKSKNLNLFDNREDNLYDYINMKKAIVNLGNNKNLYVDILKRFVKNYSESADEIKKIFDNKEYEKMDDILHTLKGISGSIGAEKLYDTIIKFREYIKHEQYDDISKNIYEFSSIYKSTLDEINKIIANESKDNSNETDNEIKDTENIICKLKEAIENGDIEAVDIFQNNKENLQKYFKEEEFKSMEEFLESYDMENALKILKSR
ncbi:ATP-binding protein [uncultured Clostridium sp.]|uniref:ATP-binding protein n=1 Tax=uncultured Clostridium sp. TaxID=59620 RepID=UPI0025CBCD52|nr:ATP-binding protein [uncultured Clostridium sp.]